MLKYLHLQVVLIFIHGRISEAIFPSSVVELYVSYCFVRTQNGRSFTVVVLLP